MPRPNGVSFMAIIITQRGAISTSATNHKRHSAATPQPMAMTLPFGRNLNASYSPPRRGGECARRKTLSKKLKVAALLHKKSQKYEHTRSKTLHRSLLRRRSCTHNLALHRDSQPIDGV